MKTVTGYTAEEKKVPQIACAMRPLSTADMFGIFCPFKFLNSLFKAGLTAVLFPQKSTKIQLEETPELLS